MLFLSAIVVRRLRRLRGGPVGAGLVRAPGREAVAAVRRPVRRGGDGCRGAKGRASALREALGRALHRGDRPRVVKNEASVLGGDVGWLDR